MDVTVTSESPPWTDDPHTDEANQLFYVEISYMELMTVELYGVIE